MLEMASIKRKLSVSPALAGISKPQTPSKNLSQGTELEGAETLITLEKSGTQLPLKNLSQEPVPESTDKISQGLWS